MIWQNGKSRGKGGEREGSNEGSGSRWVQPEQVEQTEQQSSCIGINTRIILQITKGTSVPRGTLCAWIIAIYNPYRCDHVSSSLLLIERRNEMSLNFQYIFSQNLVFMLRTSPSFQLTADQKVMAGVGWGNYRPGGRGRATIIWHYCTALD